MSTLRVATRRSALALAQTRAFCRQLQGCWPDLQISEIQIVTAGDRIQDRPLYEIGGKGLFVKEIEEALIDGRADIAIHSMKDLPAHLPPGLHIACVPERADPRDLLLVRPGLAADPPPADPLDLLPHGARVGSSSLRRQLTLRDLRPDLVVEPLRGNIDTRMRRLLAGEFDGILLAAAGFDRLMNSPVRPEIIDPPPSFPLPTDRFLPAATQGILAIQGRIGDEAVSQLLVPLEHAPSRRQARAERAVLVALGADCTVPLAVLLEDGRLRGWLWRDGRREKWVEVGENVEEGGRRLGEMLREGENKIQNSV